MNLQFLCRWSAHQGLQEQWSQRNSIPKVPTHGSIFHSMGSWWLGDQGRTRENRLEQSPILCLLQGFWHRGMPSARSHQLCFKHQKLVGGCSISRFEPSRSQTIPLGAFEPHDLRLLRWQIAVSSYPTGMHGRNLNHSFSNNYPGNALNLYVQIDSWIII